MGLRDRLRRTAATLDELHADRLQGRFGELDVVPIAQATLRVPIRIGGEICRMRMVPRAGSPSFEVTVNDGSAEAVAVFTGRRTLAGMEHGRGVLLEGVCHTERGRPVMLNPSYTLL